MTFVVLEYRILVLFYLKRVEIFYFYFNQIYFFLVHVPYHFVRV
jgi:hypothetical protein